MGWTTQVALQYARAGQLEEWIHAYLSVEEWANPGLSDGLRLRRRWWRGPLRAPLADLDRVCGPEANMEYQQDATEWEQTITRLQQWLVNPLQAAPLIIEYRKGILSVRDGSHRHEAMRRLGWQMCWIVIWYNSEEDSIQDSSRWQEPAAFSSNVRR